MAPIIAAVQLLISNPFKKKAVIFRMIAFTTKVKRPSVKIFIGKVRNNKMGRINIFKIPIKTEAIRADENPAILNPGTKYDVRSNTLEVKNQTTNQ
jgi:hypothetical protein